CTQSTRPPTAKSFQQLCLQLGRQLVLDAARQPDRRTHLLQVVLTSVAEDEVFLEAFAVNRIQCVLEVGRHQLDDLPAGKFSIQSHAKYSSSAARTFARARWSSTLPFVSVRSRALQTSSALKPSMSRSSRTARWEGGSRSSSRRITSIVSAASRRASGTPAQLEGGTAQCPGKRSPSPRKRSGGTVASLRSSPRDAKGTLRASRPPRVLAVLVTIRKSHVFSDDRPSNRSIPLRTPSQASWTTSSATDRLDTNICATRSIPAPYSRISSANAASSPARNPSTS